MSNQAQKSSDDEELSEFRVDHVDDQEDQEQSVQTLSQRSRGRPRIVEKWTRIINTSE